MDHNNNVEAVFLSPDSRLNGIVDDPATTTTNEATDNQIEAGAWTITVKAAATNAGRNAVFDRDRRRRLLWAPRPVSSVCSAQNQLGGDVLTCNDSAVVTIDEIGTGSDPIGGLTTAEIASRTKIEVVDSAGTVLDTECGVNNLTCVAVRPVLARGRFHGGVDGRKQHQLPVPEAPAHRRDRSATPGTASSTSATAT